LELDIDADAAGRYFPDVDRLGADARYEFGLLLARNADGDLIARFDRYRLRGFDLISKGLRTSRSMYYEKLEAIDYDTFDWQLDMESTPEPEPETVAPRATLAQDIARISQALTELLPENAELTRFQPREVAADAHATGSNAYIDVSGVAARNADVADFMRGPRLARRSFRCRAGQSACNGDGSHRVCTGAHGGVVAPGASGFGAEAAKMALPPRLSG
jgi:hypothetical protein